MKKTEKKIKKALRNWERCTLLFLVALMAYLAIILPIRLYVTVFSWHWFVFGLVAIIVPFAFIFLCFWSQKRFVNELQRKNTIIMTVKYILYFWLLDCLYMVIFNQWKIWIYILGVITLIKIFYSLTVAFLGVRQKNIIIDLGLIFDFLLGVALTVYLIYLIPDEFNQLQTIVTAIVAAVYGGLLTLIGVAWTIRKGDRDRKEDLRRRDAERTEEARKQFVPYIKIAHGDSVRGSVDSAVYSKLQLNSLSKQYFYSFTIKNFYIKNISNSNIILLGVFINDNYFEFENDKLVEKDTACEIKTTKNWEYASSEPLQKLIIIIGDMLGNRYEIECSFAYKTLNSLIEYTDDGKEYTGMRSDYTVTSVSLPKLISEENR